MKKYGLLVMVIAALFFINGTIFAQKPETEITSFFKAVAGGDAAGVKAMLKTLPSLWWVKNENGMSPVMVAVYNGKNEVVDVLLAAGHKLDIFEASATGQTKRVKTLIAKNKSLVNTYSTDGFLPLGYAVFFGHDAVTALLLDAGADVNLPSKEKMHVTPLHSAAAARRLEIAKKLIKLGANVNAIGQNNFTALHEVAGKGDIEFARLLVDSGADVNAKMKDGTTPLAIAAGKGDLELARLLLDHGADVNAKMDDGSTPLAVAASYNKAEMEKYLREHGGKP